MDVILRLIDPLASQDCFSNVELAQVGGGVSSFASKTNMTTRSVSARDVEVNDKMNPRQDDWKREGVYHVTHHVPVS